MYKKSIRRQQGKPLHIVYSNTVHAKHVTLKYEAMSPLYTLLSGVGVTMLVNQPQRWEKAPHRVGVG